MFRLRSTQEFKVKSLKKGRNSGVVVGLSAASYRVVRLSAEAVVKFVNWKIEKLED